MNTLAKTEKPPLLQEEDYGDYIILLENLEFAMSKKQLNHITMLHNNGVDIHEIAKKVLRNEWEVLLALIHQARKGRKLRPFAYRK